MENEADLHEVSGLPTPEEGNTLEDVRSLYQEADQLLNDLNQTLQEAYDGQENPWSGRVQAVRPQDTLKEHIIGIIGATGAGKSAFINALLDVGRLVPTSCMQACTATIIEIAYNWCPLHEFRSVVEFTSREKWRSELDTFFKHFVNASPEDLEDEASAAAIAFAKIAAVYPDLNRDGISKRTAEELMDRAELSVLGTTLEMNASTSCDMYAQLQKYVESNEKTLDSVQLSRTEVKEYWPLVERVRIYTKADILKTGCMLVDLPGTFDVNAARAATAKAYLARCASIWIVVPIQRAVDDKVAQSLLDESLKYQLRRDGTLGRVVMICSKADQCFVHELKGKLRSDGKLQEALRENVSKKKEIAKAKTDTLNAVKRQEKLVKDTSGSVTVLEAEADIYDKLLQMANDGKIVHPPVLHRAKREAAGRSYPARKQTKLGNMVSANLSQLLSSIGNDLSGPSHVAGSKGMETCNNEIKQDHTQPPMQAAAIQAKSDAIARALNELRKDLVENNEALRDANFKLEELQEWDTIIVDHEWLAYYDARNRQVVRQLQADFRSGIRELEQTEMEASDQPLLPNMAQKSAEQQLDLQVFCVASQDYQKLRGRFEDEPLSGRFRQMEETGIPELMQFCIGIGERYIQTRRKIFRGDIHQLLNSVLWLLPGQKSVRDEVSVVLPQGSMTIEDITKQLHEDLTSTFHQLTLSIDSQFNRVIDVLKQAARTGEMQALDIVQAWAAPRDADVPGLHHSTYRAVLRRGGVYTNKYRSYNWLEELLGPMVRTLDTYWIQAFKEAIPNDLKDAAEECSRLVDQFLITLIQQYEFFCIPQQERKMFKQQFESVKITLDNALSSTGQGIDEKIKLANRVPENAIGSLLRPFFLELAADHGTGVFTRNKQAMEAGIIEMKREMFTDAAKRVVKALTNCQREYRNTMWTTLEETLDARHDDCQRLFGKENQHLTGLPKQHENDILGIIRDIAALLNIEIEVNEPERASSFGVDDDSVKDEIFTQPAVMEEADPPNTRLPDFEVEQIIVENPPPTASGDLPERPETQEA